MVFIIEFHHTYKEEVKHILYKMLQNTEKEEMLSNSFWG